MENIVPVLDNMPVGFRFRPTDEELVDYYLKHKLLNDNFPVYIIPEIDLCKVEPWEVPAKSVINSDDPEWFFFSPLDYKYSNSKRVNRATKYGFWKATGNDRKIKIRGTNNVIGTKKTLVFHERRVSRGIKSNWVIHEYHAVTFHESQRTFVLCRLMKKADKKAVGGADALICDEGEPSRHMASDYENQATAEGVQAAMHQALQQSLIGIEQEAYFPNSSSFNAYFRNEINNMQTPFETTEEADEFVNSIWADEEFNICEKRSDAFVNSSTQPESLRRIYNKSSNTDAEVVSALHGNIVDTSTACNEHPSSGEYHASKMIKSSHGAVRSGMLLLSSNHAANKEKEEIIFQDDSGEVETSSSDSNADKPWEINCIEISSSPSTPRRSNNQYHLRPSNFISQTVERRSQTQRKVSNNAISHVEAMKELFIVESEKDQKNAQNSSSRENLEIRSHQSSDVKRKGSFIFLETPSSSQSPFPPSVYLVNVIIGILLLIVISWEVLSC